MFETPYMNVYGNDNSFITNLGVVISIGEKIVGNYKT